MAGKAEKRTGLTQLSLTFDTPAQLPADTTGTGMDEHPPRTNERTIRRQNGLRGKPKKPDLVQGDLTQGTLDDLFAATQDVDVPPLSFSPKDTSQIKGLLRQMTFDSAPPIPADTIAITESKPAERDNKPVPLPPDAIPLK